MEEIEIPFGRKDSELYEATYIIPEGYSAIINGNEIIVKKIEEEINLYPDSDKEAVDKIANGVKEELEKQLKNNLNESAKDSLSQVLLTQRVTYQMNDNEYDTRTESAIFDCLAPISEIREWIMRDKKNAYCWGHIEICGLKVDRS